MFKSFEDIPEKFLEKWQDIADLLAKVIDIPAALIMKTENEYMEVFISSNSENNPYHPGDKEQWHGLYCETVIKSQNELHVPNALKDENWDKNPDIKLGMIAYLGIPLNFPDQKPFGTLCVLDNNENEFTIQNRELLYQFKKVIELDLALIQALDWNKDKDDDDIIHKLIEQNEEYLAINEELTQTNNQLFDEKERVAESEAHFRLLVEHAPDTVFIQTDWKFAYINKRGLELFGAETTDQLIGTKVMDRFHPDFHEKVKQRIIGLNEKKQIQTLFEQICFKLDGTLVHVETSAIPYKYQGNDGAVVFVRDISSRKDAEQELLHRHTLMDYTIKHDPLGIAVFDNDMNFIYVSEKFLSDYNISNEDIIGKHHYEVFPEIPDKWKNVHRRVLKGEVIRKEDDVFIRKDGTVEYTRWECRPWKYEDDSIGGIIVYTEMITDRKKLENSTQQAYDLIKNMAAQVPGVLYQYRLYPDGSSSFPFSSEGMYDIYEVTSEEVKEDASIVFTRIHPDDFDYIVKGINESALNQTVYHSKFRVVLPKQGLRWRLSNAMPELLDDGSTLWHGIIMDITEEKIKEDLLIEKSEEINTFFDCTLDLLCIADIQGHFIRLNKEWEHVLGYSLSELEGKEFMEFVHPDDRKQTQQAMTQLEQSKTLTNFTNRYLCKNNNYRWIEWKSTLVGKHVYAAARDITENIRINEELVIAKEKAEESNRLKAKFLNNMSHEIRTPMNGIVGFSDLINKPDISPEKRNYYTKIVQNSSAQLLRIIDDILEISTLETKQIKLIEDPFCLNDLLMELFSIFEQSAKGRKIPLYLKKGTSDKLSYIVSDKTKLSKILSNLLENAIKYTHEGFIEFGYSVENEDLILFVKDTGIGISPENFEIIFERFAQEDKEFSESYGGLGLGLSISKENAQILGGDIQVKSEKGKGAVFLVNIPYKRAQPDDGKAVPFSNEAENSEAKQIKILVAEDEEVNFLYLEALLEEEANQKYAAIHARNGKEAVDICSHNKEIDLVLMDIKMPVMNGHEATRIIKSSNPEIPVIAQTAYTSESDRELAKQSGCDDFITKPINTEELFTLINKHLKVK